MIYKHLLQYLGYYLKNFYIFKKILLYLWFTQTG